MGVGCKAHPESGDSSAQTLLQDSTVTQALLITFFFPGVLN